MTLVSGASRRHPAAQSDPVEAMSPAAASVVYDVDGYSRSVEGVDIEVVRTGVGLGPSVVRTVQTARLVATESAIRFPMYSRATMGDDHIVVACITSAPPESRWCGIDLEPGMIVLYGPGAEHTAVNPVGVSFTFAAAAQEDLAAISDERRRRFAPPPRGQVHTLDPTGGLQPLVRRLAGFIDEAADSVVPEHDRDQRLLVAIAVALSDDRRSERIGAASRIDSRRVVHACIEFARAVGRKPSVTEMCLVAHISERGLRRAFNDEYGTPPAAFFRTWALDEARRRLRSVGPEGEVSRVALDLGFGHLGRFAVRYRETFGEPPSRTLRAAR